MGASDSCYALLDRVGAASPRQRAELVMSLRPRRDDYCRLFGPELVALEAEARYVKLWAASPVWPWPPQPTVVVRSATSEELQARASCARELPAGYRDISCWLAPKVTWTVFTLSHAGRFHVVQIDGLVQVEPDRWVWCPQPWRVLPPAPPLVSWCGEL